MDLLGPLQTRVMQHIWSSGPSTVHQVRDALMAQPESRPLAYTTVATVMRSLVHRGILAQTLRDRTHSYAACVDAPAYHREMLRQLRYQFFHGDLRAMFAAIACDESLDPGERALLQSLLVAQG